jgi:multiple sugar transport system permease protein
MKQYHNTKIIKVSLCILFSFAFIFPLVWIFFTAVKTDIEVRTSLSILPTGSWHWENFVNAWRFTNFGRQFFNSTIMSFSVTFGRILTSALAGYAFSRLQFKGRSLLFGICLASLIIPYQLLVLPIYLMFSQIGWLDTFAALIVPSIADAFGIFMFKQHFDTIPVSIEEAAKIDGASRWKTLWKIILPISRAPAVTLFLLTFIAEWNDLFKPLIYTSSDTMRTVQMGLTMFQDQFSTNYTLLMAAVLFVTAPALLLFLIGQRQFIAGIATTGAKG